MVFCYKGKISGITKTTQYYNISMALNNKPIPKLIDRCFFVSIIPKINRQKQPLDKNISTPALLKDMNNVF
jgi:hypothetical protein